MTKKRALFILHYSPPAHGASKVGDFIKSSQKISQSCEARFIKIKSSDTIGDIGKVNILKIYYAIELYIKVMFALLCFRPNVIYFTASVKSIAFYRDVLLSTLWKFYTLFSNCSVFYHYHTKGIDEFTKNSTFKLSLTRFFLKKINLILLSPLLENDFDNVKTFKTVHYLPNGVEDTYKNSDNFEQYIKNKNFSANNVLYLSNMIKSKGYFEVLKLAKSMKGSNTTFHFAGGWQNDDDEKEFFDYIKTNHLEESVTFHGFVDAEEKKQLFESASVLVFPTRYKLEALSLVVIEALSYGLPALTTDEGSLPFIVNNQCGHVVSDVNELEAMLRSCMNNLVNIETAMYCRKRYLDMFTLNIFENKLISILNL